jgi:hypothetical protein
VEERGKSAAENAGDGSEIGGRGKFNESRTELTPREKEPGKENLGKLQRGEDGESKQEKCPLGSKGAGGSEDD